LFWKVIPNCLVPIPLSKITNPAAEPRRPATNIGRAALPRSPATNGNWNVS